MRVTPKNALTIERVNETYALILHFVRSNIFCPEHTSCGCCSKFWQQFIRFRNYAWMSTLGFFLKGSLSISEWQQKSIPLLTLLFHPPFIASFVSSLEKKNTHDRPFHKAILQRHFQRQRLLQGERVMSFIFSLGRHHCSAVRQKKQKTDSWRCRYS